MTFKLLGCLTGHANAVGALAVAPDGSWLTSAGFDGVVRIWDADTGAPRHTLGSYGRVDSDGAAVNPDRYDYRRAARDAIHFPALVDRFWPNTRRCVGWNVQYFGTVEPQKRGTPHFHTAIRGTIPRAELRAITAATYHQVWWPTHDELLYTGEKLPVWDTRAKAFTDPDTGTTPPTIIIR